MSSTDFENVVGAQVESIEAVIPEKIEPLVKEPERNIRKLVPREALRTALIMSAAYIGAAVLAPLLHRQSPWQGLNAVASTLPRFRGRSFLSPLRVRRHFEPGRALVSVGLITAGAFALALAQRKLDGTARRQRVLRGAVPALAAFAFDRLVGARTFWPGMRRALGRDGLGLVYGALGAAAAFSSKPEAHKHVDPSGGDIAAGVPAM